MTARIPALSTAVFSALVIALGIPASYAHEGVPLDPTITESSPRESSRLYLERKDLPWTNIEPGIAYQEIRPGIGPQPSKGAIVYIMWRMFDMKDGREIYYRTKHRTDHFFYEAPEEEALGGGATLRAVQLAMKDMREGGKRLLVVTADKAFGKEGWSDSHFVVPPDTNVVIELSLLWVRDPDPRRFTPGEPYRRPSELLAPRKETRSHETSAPLQRSDNTTTRAS